LWIWGWERGSGHRAIIPQVKFARTLVGFRFRGRGFMVDGLEVEA